MTRHCDDCPGGHWLDPQTGVRNGAMLTTRDQWVVCPGKPDESEAFCQRAEQRERHGRRVREIWVTWARQQPNAPPHWLLPYDELPPEQQEVDMRIGAALWGDGFADGLEASPRPDETEALRQEQRWRKHASAAAILAQEVAERERQRAAQAEAERDRVAKLERVLGRVHEWFETMANAGTLEATTHLRAEIRAALEQP